MVDKKRLTHNTFFLYLRTIFLIIITLYSSRILLKTLGIDGYGVYNLVASVVLLFGSVRGLLATATQRFLNYTRGRGSIKDVADIFTISIRIHAAMAILFLIVVEILGLYMITYKLNIPAEYTTASYILLQCTIGTIMLSVMTIPYDAVIISNESFNAFAYFAILDEGLKLIGAFMLFFISANQVVWYGIFVLISALIVLIVRMIFSKRKYEECRCKGQFEWGTCKNISKFIGWNALGFSTLTLYNEGINMLLNIFGGVVANAARAIANQVLQGITGFSTKLIAAASPQAVQKYSQEKYEEFFGLIFFSSKTISLLFLFMGAAIYTFTEPILQLWLGKIPPYSMEFIRILIIYGFILSFHSSLDLCFKAYGNLKKYQIMAASCNLSILLAAYIVFKLGAPLVSAFYVMTCGTFIKVVLEIYLARVQVHLPIFRFLREVLLPSALVLVSLAAIYLLISYLDTNLWISIPIYIALAPVAIFTLGLNNGERNSIRVLIAKKIKF